MNNPQQLFPGISVQWPISQKLIDGSKAIETRTYPLPEKYIGVDLILIETPGSAKLFEARLIGIIRFGIPFKYKSETHFYRDAHRHLVDKLSPWAWGKKAKWGWPVTYVKPFKRSIRAPNKRGIIFTREVGVASYQLASSMSSSVSSPP